MNFFTINPMIIWLSDALDVYVMPLMFNLIGTSLLLGLPSAFSLVSNKVTRPIAKLYDLNSHVVFFSRDVVFHEASFPFSSSPPLLPTSSLPSLPFPVCDHSSPPLPITPLSPYTPLSHLSSFSISSFVMSPSSSPPAPCLPPRVRQTPTWLHDFVTNCTVIVPTPTSLASSSGSPILLLSASQSSSLPDDLSYEQAYFFPEWCQAMQEEIQALEGNNT